MTYFNNYKVDGVPILTPDQDAEITRNDLDGPDSGRDESGFMHRTVLRHRVHTWGFSYGVLTEEEYRYMKSLFDDKSTFKFTYTESGMQKITDAYCSGDSIAYRNAVTGDYRNCKIKIIEC